jgi:predicted AAA+ superfamily ATPase
VSTSKYLENIICSDISRIDGSNKDENKVRALFKSISRNICCLPNIETFSKDVYDISKINISRITINDYLDRLKKLNILKEIPPFSIDVKSNVTLRKTPKLILCDSSLAAASLKLNTETLMNQLNYFGHLFENYVIRDLSIYATINDYETSYYQDNKDGKIDCIITNEKND